MKKALKTKKYHLITIIVFLLVAFWMAVKGKNQAVPSTPLAHTAIEGNDEVALEIAYSTKELQLYSPQCLPSTNNKCRENVSFLSPPEQPDSLVISLFSYYKDNQITTIADYHTYLVENNMGTNIEYVEVGKPGELITAIHFIPTLKLVEDIALPVESYAIIGDSNSLFLIRLYNRGYSDIFDTILSSISFRM